MGVKERLKRMWGGSQKTALQLYEEKAQEMVVVIEGDGFIPAIQFSGNDLDELLEASTWSYACITSNSRELSSLPGMVQRRGKDGEDEWVRDRKHEVVGFLEQPFGVSTTPPNWSWQQLLETIALHLYLDGNAYLIPVLVDSGKRLHSVRLCMPAEVTVKEGANGYPESYLIGGQTYKAGQIVHIMNASPGSRSKGIAAMHSALRPVEIDRIAQERQKANLKNKVAPGMVLSIKASASMGLDKAARTKVEQMLKDNYTKATHDGRPLVVGDDVKLVAPPQTNNQLAYFETRRFSRDEIIAIFGTPPPVVGVYDNATLQNFAQALRVWWMSALFPMLGAIMSAINRQLIEPVYGPDVRIWYDLTGSEIALMLLQERIATAKSLVDLGYPTNMAAAHVGLGMPHVKELDQANTQLVAAGRTDAAAAKAMMQEIAREVASHYSGAQKEIAHEIAREVAALFQSH